jgi:hypothetical protein
MTTSIRRLIECGLDRLIQIHENSSLCRGDWSFCPWSHSPTDCWTMTMSLLFHYGRTYLQFSSFSINPIFKWFHDYFQWLFVSQVHSRWCLWSNLGSNHKNEWLYCCCHSTCIMRTREQLIGYFEVTIQEGWGRNRLVSWEHRGL